MSHAQANKNDFIIAGNINLDIIPSLPNSSHRSEDWGQLLIPGRLIEIGAAITSTGGSVSNIGMALSRLGFSSHLVSKIADDYFGDRIRALLEEQETHLSSNLIISPTGSTSYTLVMSLPGTDRLFLHSPGVNDSFSEVDIPYDLISNFKIFHFGYPPLMRRMYADKGRELINLFQRVKSNGLVTSLDMAKPDANSDAGAADWRNILIQTLPYVDLFLPSFEEILFMLHPRIYKDLEEQWGRANVNHGIEAGLLRMLSDELLEMGCTLVGIKLGDKGLYLRTSEQSSRYSSMESKLNIVTANWSGRELLSPCFQVQVSGTTGSGDCTIAGLLAGLAKGLPLEQVLTTAVAVGAYSVEHPDATSGIPAWNIVQDRIKSNWPRIPVHSLVPGWRWDDKTGLWFSGHDSSRQH